MLSGGVSSVGGLFLYLGEEEGGDVCVKRGGGTLIFSVENVVVKFLVWVIDYVN